RFRRRHKDYSFGADNSQSLDAALGVATTRPVVAVVPLKSFTGGTKERFVADLLVDDVAVRLGRIDALEVIDCLTAGSPAETTESLCQTAVRLRANFAFGGTVSRVGRRVRLTVRLIEGKSGVLAWGDQFDQPLDQGPLDSQDNIADRIAANIRCFFGIT